MTFNESIAKHMYLSYERGKAEALSIALKEVDKMIEEGDGHQMQILLILKSRLDKALNCPQTKPKDSLRPHRFDSEASTSNNHLLDDGDKTEDSRKGKHIEFPSNFEKPSKGKETTK